MKAILLAAGLGTRLRPITDHIPKCLVPINGRPLLEYWVLDLAQAGISSLLVNLHYKADLVKRFIEEGDFSIPIKTVFEKKLLMTGGTLLKNQAFFGEQPVMLVHADNLCSCNFREFINSHTSRPNGTEITMMTFTTTSPENCGIVEIDDDGIVRGFYEKVQNPPSRLANAAVYIIDPSIIKFIANLGKKEVDFSTEVLPLYIGKINTWHNDEYHRDIGNIESLLAAQIEFPRPTKILKGEDPWQMLVGKNSLNNIQNILSAFLDGFNAYILPLNLNKFSKLLEGLDEISKTNRNNIILLSDHPHKNLYEQIIQVKKTISEEMKILIIFIQVKEGFSSKKIFEDTGLFNIAISTISEKKY